MLKKLGLAVLISLTLLACGGAPDDEAKEKTEPTGASQNLPIFQPSRMLSRAPYPPYEKTGFRWTFATESDLRATMDFYAKHLPEGHTKARIESKVKKDLLGMRYTYKQGGKSVEVVLRQGRFLLTEYTPVPEPTGTPTPPRE